VVQYVNKVGEKFCARKKVLPFILNPPLTESDLALTESINVQVQQSAQYKCKVKMIHVTRSLYLQIYPSTLCIAYPRFYSMFRMSVDVDE